MIDGWDKAGRAARRVSAVTAADNWSSQGTVRGQGPRGRAGAAGDGHGRQVSLESEASWMETRVWGRRVVRKKSYLAGGGHLAAMGLGAWESMGQRRQM